MIEQALYDAFNDCINRLAAGQSVEDCLRIHPRHSAVLRPMLEAGRLARRAAYPAEQVNSARERGQFRLEAAMNRALPLPGGLSRGPLARFAASFAAVFVLFIALAGGIVLAAEGSLPGDPLYGVKRTTEQVRLSLSGDPSLILSFEQRRVDETRLLMSRGRETTVTFRGIVQAIDADSALWRVEGLTLTLDSQTDVPPDIPVGSRVEVEATTLTDGRLLARVIRRLESPQDRPLIPTPELPRTAIASPTVSPSLTPIPTATATVTPTRTARATETRAARPSATVTSTPEDLARATDVPCRPQPQSGWTRYTIQPGDRLSGLAQRTGTTVETIVRVNCIRDPNVLTVGAVLYLPSAAPDSPSLEPTPVPSTRPSERPAPTSTPSRR